MFVRDIMTTNVVTIPSSTPLPDAGEILRVHRIERLPVVDKGKLVGIVTKDSLLRAAPSPATSLARYELSYLLSKMTVRQIMTTPVVTTTPDATVESAIESAQEGRVGCLPVLENDRVVGIVTTNDFFYAIINPLFGIGETGTTGIIVYGAGSSENAQKVTECLNRLGIKIKALFTVSPPEARENDFVIQLDTKDAEKIVAELRSAGYSAEVRVR